MNAFKWWWLSHADDSGFLGVVIIPAPDFISANKIKHILNLNPGGEVNGALIIQEAYKYITLDDTMKILDKERSQKISGLIDGVNNDRRD